jgi:hypothetical protein
VRGSLQFRRTCFVAEHGEPLRHNETFCARTERNVAERTEGMTSKTGTKQSGPARSATHSPPSGPRYRGRIPASQPTFAHRRRIERPADIPTIPSQQRRLSSATSFLVARGTPRFFRIYLELRSRRHSPKLLIETRVDSRRAERLLSDRVLIETEVSPRPAQSGARAASRPATVRRGKVPGLFRVPLVVVEFDFGDVGCGSGRLPLHETVSRGSHCPADEGPTARHVPRIGVKDGVPQRSVATIEQRRHADPVERLGAASAHVLRWAACSRTTSSTGKTSARRSRPGGTRPRPAPRSPPAGVRM